MEFTKEDLEKLPAKVKYIYLAFIMGTPVTKMQYDLIVNEYQEYFTEEILERLKNK